LLLLLLLLLQLHAADGLQLLQNETPTKQLTQNKNTSFTDNLLHSILHVGQIFRKIVDEVVTYSWLLKFIFHYGNVLIVSGF
jgi:hypothetical protein